jgi:divalent metal cation (Fe/Co/Zn/Cd) transporter
MVETENNSKAGSPPQDHAATGKLVAAWVTSLSVMMVVVKVVAGGSTRSPALVASALHSVVEVLAASTLWFGFRQAAHSPRRRFSSWAFCSAAAVSVFGCAVVLIAATGVSTWAVAWLRDHRLPGGYWRVEAVSCALVMLVFSLMVFLWERAVARRLNSHSLLVAAKPAWRRACAC